MSTYAILVAAYNPSSQLTTIVEQLLNAQIKKIIIVNDGSDKQYNPIFQEISEHANVILLNHAKNQGKGAALKTGFHYLLAYHSEEFIGIITADSDGQHTVKDIIAIGEQLQNNPHALIIGQRNFDNVTIPWCSRFGNQLTRRVMRALFHFNISDTQSGLRGIPISLIPQLLKIKANHYEFELVMLLICAKNDQKIIKHPIQTIYFNNNSNSHFKPIIDSVRIYYQIFLYKIFFIKNFYS